MLSLEKQQLLISQVQRQQQQIQKLQSQVQQLVVQQQQQKALEEKRELEAPVFVAPPVNNLKLRHSEAYLRYLSFLLLTRRFFVPPYSEAHDRVQRHMIPHFKFNSPPLFQTPIP